MYVVIIYYCTRYLYAIELWHRILNSLHNLKICIFNEKAFCQVLKVTKQQPVTGLQFRRPKYIEKHKIQNASITQKKMNKV